ncbi:hypothetical protein GCM10022287_00540 [Gryllotalpicola koreensis]|uniref:DUF4082 domain-containing protein n=2 Tax=Gryllotalpicola koreensis TaxID=993086 RepID=A0ABP7ZPH0_9MICO
MTVVFIAIVSMLAAFLVLGDSKPSLAASDPCGTGSNPIVCENSKPGTPRDQWDIGTTAGSDKLQGFATSISVQPGGTVQFKINSSDLTSYQIEIYRTGWYNGDGARLVGSASPSVSLPQTQPACIFDSTTYETDCGNWAVSASWNVPSTAVSGVYVADLWDQQTGDASQITFVVTDPSSHSDILVKTSDATWQAYNPYGGADFYQGAGPGRAYAISYNRPVTTRGADYSAAQGRDFYFDEEYPLVQFLEENGYDVSYTTDVDTAIEPASMIEQHKIFVSSGHDEYWSTQERANVEAARDAGVNLSFQSGNEVYWHTTLTPSIDPSHTPNRTITSYKDTWSNDWINPGSTWTGTWRDPRFATKAQGGSDPENSLTGQIFMTQLSDDPITVTSGQGKMKLWANTGLNSMTGSSVEVADHLIGYEADEDLDNGFRQSGTLWLSTTSYDAPQRLTDYGSVVAEGQSTHHMTLYRAASGALVFAAGTIDWNWGLNDNHDEDVQAADSRIQQFQVNLYALMGVQPQTLMSGLVAGAGPTDSTPPTASVTSPAPGSAIANGASVTVTGTAADVGGVVAAVEISVDNGQTWHMATGTTSWSYSFVMHGMGQQAVLVRAVDDSANYASSPVSASYQVTGPYSALGNATPSLIDAGDTSANELGLRFTATQGGSITGVRFYKSAQNTGTHTGTLWDANGNRLATATFTNETASGWQSASFATPVTVSAGASYVVSYTDPNGHYSADTNYFDYRGSSFAPLTLSGGEGSQDPGVFGTPGDFPTSSWQNANYYVDAIFSPSSDLPLTASSQWPLPASSSVPLNTNITAVLSQDASPSTVSVQVKDQLGNAVAGATSYNSGSRTVTFTPSQPLSGFVTYSVTLSAATASGTSISSGGRWSFTTVKPDPTPGVCPCGLFTDSTTPDVLEAGDSNSVTLGTRFTPSEDGTVTGVSFYKAAGNTGTHVGSLWNSSGAELAVGTFTNESTSGWQTLTFSSPVSVTAGQSYVVAYRTDSGNYSVSAAGFGSGLTVGPLSADADAGVYSYADTYPSTATTTSYLVDVVFMGAAPALQMTNETPAQGATNVDVGAAISLSVSSPLAAGYSFSVASGGAAIAGSAALSADGKTVTFTPASPLPGGDEIDVKVTGLVGVNGATLAAQNWSFTTAAPGAAPYSLFGSDSPSSSAVGQDASPVELGVSFSPSVSGSVTAIKFYKSAGQTGTQTGHLWSSSGVLLATVNFTSETASGWQSATLSSPVALEAGTSYVVSYFASQGGYSYSGGYFSSAHTSGVLTAGSSGNGRFLYSTTGGGFPTYSYNSTNYFVDVDFVAGDTGSTPTPTPTPTSTTTPSAALSIFNGATPANTDNADGTPVQLGVKFSSSKAGTITGISYYRSPGDTAADTVNLWDATGALRATAAVPASTGSGWQTIALPTPVTISAGQSYVASYYSPSKHYPYDAGGLSSAVVAGPLTATSGEYIYGTGFPANDSATNYWVDVKFVPSS